MCVGKNYSDHVAEIARKSASSSTDVRDTHTHTLSLPHLSMRNILFFLKQSSSSVDAAIASAQTSALKHATFFTKVFFTLFSLLSHLPSLLTSLSFHTKMSLSVQFSPLTYLLSPLSSLSQS